MELATQTPGLVGARIDARGRGRGGSLELSPAACRPRPREPRSEGEADASTAPDLEKVWDRHGGSVYALACALLGDEAAAVRVVTLAMVDLALSTDGESHEDTLRFLARRVYRHSQEVPVEPSGGPTCPRSWCGSASSPSSNARAWRCASSAGTPIERRRTCSAYRPARWPSC